MNRRLAVLCLLAIVTPLAAQQRLAPPIKDLPRAGSIAPPPVFRVPERRSIPSVPAPTPTTPSLCNVEALADAAALVLYDGHLPYVEPVCDEDPLICVELRIEAKKLFEAQRATNRVARLRDLARETGRCQF